MLDCPWAASARLKVVSVDTKKKERVGDFKNGGREWQPKGRPEAVHVYDFIDPQRVKVAKLFLLVLQPTLGDYQKKSYRIGVGWIRRSAPHPPYTRSRPIRIFAVVH
jgi:hypothetical protein